MHISEQPLIPHRLGLSELVAHACDLKAVFTDLDGTFLDARHRMPAGAERIIGRLQNTGVRFVPASGRTTQALRSFFGNLYERIDAVACNGMDVVMSGQTVRHLPFPLEHARRLLTVVERHPRRMGFAVFGPKDPYLIDLEADFARTVIESLEHARTVPLAAGIPDEEIEKVAVIAYADAAAAARELSELMGDAFDFAECGDHWIDVMPKGTDKINGVQFVMERLGAQPHEVVAFGDSMNDLRMMQSLPLSVAVSNALPGLKEHCSFEIGSNADNAVLNCLAMIADLREGAPVFA